MITENAFKGKMNQLALEDLYDRQVKERVGEYTCVCVNKLRKKDKRYRVVNEGT